MAKSRKGIIIRGNNRECNYESDHSGFQRPGSYILDNTQLVITEIREEE